MYFTKLRCSKCRGPKFIGDEYYAFGTYYVDITCVTCGDSKDVEINKLYTFLEQVDPNFKRKDVNKETNSK